MHLLDIIWPARMETRLTEISGQIANRIRQAVWQRVSRRLPAMGIAESRGYIRTRAVAVIHREVDAALRNDSAVQGAYRSRLIELTQDEIVRLISIQRFKTAPVPVAVPAIRRAA